MEINVRMLRETGWIVLSCIMIIVCWVAMRRHWDFGERVCGSGLIRSGGRGGENRFRELRAEM